MSPAERELTERLKGLGFSHDVASSLAQNVEGDYMQLKHLSSEELFERYCTWNGLIGFAGSLMAAVDNIRQHATKIV